MIEITDYRRALPIQRYLLNEYSEEELQQSQSLKALFFGCSCLIYTWNEHGKDNSLS